MDPLLLILGGAALIATLGNKVKQKQKELVNELREAARASPHVEKIAMNMAADLIEAGVYNGSKP